MTDISYEESLALPAPAYLDVRAPAEFAEDHVPGAENLPLFDDDERAAVGTIYRAMGRDEAIVSGTKMVGGKLDQIVSRLLGYRGRNPVIYCARGGMRSQSVASLAGSLGIAVHRLIDGYRGYRRYVSSLLENIDDTKPLFVLQGLTGTGKTAILRHMPRSVDLEGMAGHRSSIFGGLGLEQNSQKNFESLLAARIRELAGEPWLVVEGESRKIGNLHIPPAFYRWMKASPAILVTAPMEKRVAITVAEYTRDFDPPAAAAIVRSIRTKLGDDTMHRLLALLDAGDYPAFCEILLGVYYDPRYNHKIGKMHFIATVEHRDTAGTAAELAAIIDSRLRDSR